MRLFDDILAAPSGPVTAPKPSPKGRRKPESVLARVAGLRGRRGPSKKPALSRTQAALLPYWEAISPLCRKDFVALLGCSESHLRGIVNGHRGLEPGRFDEWAAKVSPVRSPDDSAMDDPLWEWAKVIEMGGGDHANEGPTCGQSPQPETFVGFDYVAFTAKADGWRELRDLFNAIIPDGCGEALFFEMNGVELSLEAAWAGNQPGGKRRGRRIYFVRAVRFGHQVVARIYIGRRGRKCREHRAVRGEHKGGGIWRLGCGLQMADRKCPASHFHFHPHRCGQCQLPDSEYWGCARCRELNGASCPICQDRLNKAPDLTIEVAGLGCQLGLLIPLVGQFFSRFASSSTVVRHGTHVAVSVNEPVAALVPIQNDNGRYSKLKVARSEPNGPDVSPGTYIGGASFRLVVYDKFGERRFRLLEQCRLYLPTPSPVVDGQWRNWGQLEVRDGRPTRAGDAANLDDLINRARGLGLADLRRHVGSAYVRSLLLDAKALGFVERRPSLKALSRKRDLDARRSHRNTLDFADAILMRQVRGSDAQREDVADALVKAIQAELEAIRHPLDLAGTIATSRPKLERELRDALARPHPRTWLLPPTPRDEWRFRRGNIPTPAPLQRGPCWRIASGNTGPGPTTHPLEF